MQRKEVYLCRCGCELPGIPERADDAVLLAKGKAAAKALEPKLMAGERTSEQAAHLLWAWGRAESPLDEWVHNLPPSGFLGLPSPRWVTSFVRRANKLAGIKPSK